MTRAPIVALAIAVLAGAAGCFRLSDPVYAFKNLSAPEPSAEGTSLVFGTVFVETAGSGDLDSVSFLKVGPGAERSRRGANRVNLFRVFFPRTMKDNHFVVELPPGAYELEAFLTSGWGQPHRYEMGEEARKSSRFLVTRPGVYDIGTWRAALDPTQGISIRNRFRYTIERVDEDDPKRQSVLAHAIEGTRWERLGDAKHLAR